MWKGILFKSSVILLLLVLVLTLKGQQPGQKDIVKGKFSPVALKEILLAPEKWDYIPKPGAAWDRLPEELKDEFIESAEEALEFRFESIPATLAMEFHRNGNRSRHREVYYAKREKLASLVLGECLERKGRFLDQITNGIWSIAEESWWAFPAHYSQYGMQALPDVRIQYVDLFAAETGILLAWTHYLLGDELDRVSPEVDRRILYEVDRRILTPCLELKDFHWMGYRDTSLNNWTPWICSNWIGCVLLCEQDPSRKAEAIYKNMEILDHFLAPYNTDGGCDEGPAYWGRAGASLYDCLEWLKAGSGGEIDVWDHPLVKNIGKYICKVHIKDDYYVNFADASALVKPDPTVVFRYGKEIGDERMVHFGAWLLEKNGYEFLQNSWMGRKVQGLFALDKMNGTKAEITYGGSWLPDLEVMVAREEGKDGNGFFLAAKGGFNKESHNHNDAGSFVVYFNGKPVLIDVGVETYTKKTFSSSRYDIWTMQSQYHNLPTINGEKQAPGLEYKAEQVKYSSTARRDQMSLDIAHAYPESASVNSWNRALSLDKSQSRVTITENYSLAEAREPVILNLMSHSKPGIDQSGNSVFIPVADEDGSIVKLRYPKGYKAIVEECDSSDPRLAAVWGDLVYRIRITAPKAQRSGKIELVLTKAR